MTILFAILLFLLAAAGLGISLLLTGKNRLHCRRCAKPEKCPCKKAKKNPTKR